MKGLLIKDLRLMLAQKRFFLMVGGVAVLLASMNNDATFLLWYTTLIISQFAVSTVSYDEFDNGFPFLFTLPVSRRGYAVEKYLFGLLLALAAWVFSTLLSLAVATVQGGALLDVLASGAAILPVVLLMQSVTLPLQIKYGGEKGRLILFGAAGVIFVLVAGGSMLIDRLTLNAESVISLLNQHGGLIAAGILALALGVWAASMAVSIRIVEEKEF